MLQAQEEGDGRWPKPSRDFRLSPGIAKVGAAVLAGLPLLAGIAAPATAAPVFSVVYTFTGGADGSNPTAGLIADSAGDLYGTTPYGGLGFGVVFELSPEGSETVLYTFTGGDDGSGPYGGLVQDASGNLYGTTYEGGPSHAGVVFRLDPTGQETVLHAFTGGSDGASPVAALIRDDAGNLYGTTQFGGNPACQNGCGVVFEIDATGLETVLYRFAGGRDGQQPVAGLLRDATGNLYGTTLYGGAPGGKCGTAGCGTVFKLSPTAEEIVLHAFRGPDGELPEAGVVQDSAGNLYGTTLGGGAYNEGTVFMLGPTGLETVLHSFADLADGSRPGAGVIRDTSGNLYGTTSIGPSGGTYTSGVVFKLSPAGRETVLYSFTGGADGSSPLAGLLPLNGYLYGTAYFGGDRPGIDGNGTVFEVSLP
jgi:uncharacterized repeat protein (TIGR03803 family)